VWKCFLFHESTLTYKKRMNALGEHKELSATNGTTPLLHVNLILLSGLQADSCCVPYNVLYN
jgi:hypothetical protein